MMASQSTMFSEVVRTIAGLDWDEQIMGRYRAMEDFIVHERSQQEKIRSQKETIRSQQEKIRSQREKIGSRQETINSQQETIDSLKDSLADALARIAELEGNPPVQPGSESL